MHWWLPTMVHLFYNALLRSSNTLPFLPLTIYFTKHFLISLQYKPPTNDLLVTQFVLTFDLYLGFQKWSELGQCEWYSSGWGGFEGTPYLPGAFNPFLRSEYGTWLIKFSRTCSSGGCRAVLELFFNFQLHLVLLAIVSLSFCFFYLTYCENQQWLVQICKVRDLEWLSQLQKFFSQSLEFRGKSGQILTVINR